MLSESVNSPSTPTRPNTSPSAAQNGDQPPAYTAPAPVDAFEKGSKPAPSTSRALKLALSDKDHAAMARKQFKDARQARGTALRDAARELEKQVVAALRDMDGQHWRENPRFKEITDVLARLDKQTGTRHEIYLKPTPFYLAADGFRLRYWDAWVEKRRSVTVAQAAKIASIRLTLAEEDVAVLSRSALEQHIKALPDVVEPLPVPGPTIVSKGFAYVGKGLAYTVFAPITAGRTLWDAHKQTKRWLKLAHAQGNV